MPTPPAPGGPFYFAWASSSETTFTSSHYAYDETIFSFTLTHEEGQIPTLEVEILNPNVGLLNSGRHQWAWFSWWNGSAVVPLFFGRLVGIPTDMLGSTVRLQFIARANDYLTRKRNLAQSLKVRPYYDPLFLDEKSRHDPDAILEGYSAAWHVDRTTLDWTISDIVRPEDGTVVFTESDVFYDSVSVSVGTQPLKTLYVKTDVAWERSATGAVPVGLWAVKSWTGNGIISDWPKPGASLGGGWVADQSWVIDVAKVDDAQVVNYSASYQNQDTSHAIGDTMSASYSVGVLKFKGDRKVIKFTVVEKIGTVSGSVGDVPNSSVNTEEEVALCYDLLCYLSVRYESKSGFGETLQIRVDADVQNLLFDAETEQDTEVLELNAADVTQPIIDYATAASVENTSVGLGQLILDPNKNYQICVEAGLTGTTPTFSTTIGVATVDLGATWVCLGPTLPAIGDWSASTAYKAGALIAPSAPSWETYSALTSIGSVNHTGVAVALGIVVKADNGLSFQRCVVAGTTSGWAPAFSSTAGDLTTDGTVTWESLGPNLPSGVVQICVTAGTSGAVPPAWSVSGGTVTDGSAVWTSLATSPASITSAVGGAGLDPAATAFFPTDRGARAAEYCLMRARAKMLTRARAIDITWQTTFAKGVGLSCRKSAQISDARIPGGVAEGKIISYSLTGDGGSGQFQTEVKIGVCVGTDGTITAGAGTPVYADGWADGYQQAAGAVLPISGALNDIGYTPLTDPGYSLTVNTNISATWVGSAALQESQLRFGNVPPLFMALTLPNVEASDYATPYNLQVTTLKIPKGIDLSAA